MSYYWGFDKDVTEIWEACDSVEDCIKEAIRTKDVDTKYAYYGVLIPHVATIRAEDIIEQLQENAQCEYGIDLVGDWLENLNGEDIEVLGNKLNEILSEWIMKTSNNPTFGKIVDIEKIDL